VLGVQSCPRCAYLSCHGEVAEDVERVARRGHHGLPLPMGLPRQLRASSTSLGGVDYLERGAEGRRRLGLGQGGHAHDAQAWEAAEAVLWEEGTAQESQPSASAESSVFGGRVRPVA
jgi:hypothetical protein